MFAPDATFSGIDEHGTAFHVSPTSLRGWYAGTVNGEEDSAVRLTVVDTSHYYGTVSTSTDGTFLIEQRIRPDRVRRALDDPLLQNNTHMLLDMHAMVSGHILHSVDSELVETVIYHSSLAAAPLPSQCGSEPPMNITDQHEQQQEWEGDGSSASATLGRERRGPPLSLEHTRCSLFLDAEANFFQQWGGVGTMSERVTATIIKMVDIIYQVDGVYSNSRNFAGTLNLYIVGSKVQTEFGFEPDPTQPSLGSQVLRLYQMWLAGGTRNGISPRVRGADLPTSQEVCLNHLFVHLNLRGVLGVAIQAVTDKDVIGGVCEPTIAIDSTTNAPYSVNVGFTTTSTSSGSVVPTWQNVLSTAHELGHNFGAAHDCEFVQSSDRTNVAICSAAIGKTVCNPNDAQGGPFIMHPSVATTDDHKNARVFSPCSLAQVANVLRVKGSCFIKPDPCANGGTCCVGKYLRPKDYVCADVSALPCYTAPTCTGTSSTCPAPIPRPDGAACNLPSGEHGLCSSGLCTHPHDAFCKTQSADLQGCFLPGNECVRACKNANTVGCVAFESVCQLVNPGTGNIEWWSEASPTCTRIAAGSPCTVSVTDSNGICAVNGSCVACKDAACSTELAIPNVTSPAPLCSYKITVRSPCSEPCGGGQRAVGYSCVCEDGTTDETGASCGSYAAPTDLETCNTQACEIETAQQLQLTLHIPFVSFDRTGFENTLRSILALRVDLVGQIITVPNEGLIRVNVQSCRQTSGGCLTVGQLRNLTLDVAKAQLEASLGYTIEMSSGSKSDDPFNITLIAILVAVIVATGVLVGAIIYYVDQGKRRAAEIQAIRTQQRQARGDGSTRSNATTASGRVAVGASTSNSNGGARQNAYVSTGSEGRNGHATPMPPPLVRNDSISAPILLTTTGAKDAPSYPVDGAGSTFPSLSRRRSSGSPPKAVNAASTKKSNEPDLEWEGVGLEEEVINPKLRDYLTKRSTQGRTMANPALGAIVASTSFSSGASDTSTTSSASRKKRGSAVALKIANSDYQATHSNELSFAAGDIIKVYSNVRTPPGWSYGEANGRGGFLPTSHISSLVDDDASSERSQSPSKSSARLSVFV